MRVKLECRFIEFEPGRWIYTLQDGPGGAWPQEKTYGPFGSFSDAVGALEESWVYPDETKIEICAGHVHEFMPVGNNPTTHGHEEGHMRCISCGATQE